MDTVKLQLVLASRRCRRERDRQRCERRQQLVEEMHEAWEGRRLAEVHRLRAAVASNGRGATKRFFWAQTIHQKAAEDWSSYLRLPGEMGGLNARRVDWEQYKAAHIDKNRVEQDPPLPDDANIKYVADRDHQAMS